MDAGRTDSGESTQFRPTGRGLWVSMGEFIVELAYVRNESAEQNVDVQRERERPLLRAVPDLTPSQRPALPRRPSRRAVVRARVWGVPLSAADDGVGEWAPVDARIAEAVRLLASH